MKPISGWEEIPYDPDAIEEYKTRLIETIQDKVQKARKDYDTQHPLILAIYVNEYISIHMDEEDWRDLVKTYENIFDTVDPFSEIVLWNPSSILDDSFFTFSVRPTPRPNARSKGTLVKP